MYVCVCIGNELPWKYVSPQIMVKPLKQFLLPCVEQEKNNVAHLRDAFCCGNENIGHINEMLLITWIIHDARRKSKQTADRARQWGRVF